MCGSNIHHSFEAVTHEGLNMKVCIIGIFADTCLLHQGSSRHEVWTIIIRNKGQDFVAMY